MTNYIDLFKGVIEFIETEYEVECDCYVGDDVSQDMIKKAEKKMNFSIPKQLKEFYFQAGDGLEMHWHLEESEKFDIENVYGRIEIPSLKELINALDMWQDMCVPNIESAYEDTPDTSEEKQKFKEILSRAQNCIPITVENGDVICIEKDGSKDPIVYWEHGSCELYFMSENFERFINDWSQCCFQKPLFWPLLNGINWDDEYFYKPLRERLNK